jgi:hypothetical protein
MKDYQKSRVYAWEDEFLFKRAPRWITFDNAQCFVDGIFLCEQLVGSPKVELMPKQMKRHLADGSRSKIRVREKTQAWVIIHELAHTLTDDAHGPNFMGIYMKLLDKYADVSILTSMYSLKNKKIDYNLSAVPCFKDK